MPNSLAGKTIVVTRARPQAGVFSAALSKLGAKVIEIPTIEIVPTNAPELDAAIQSLDGYDWLFFTSVNGVITFFQRLKKITPSGVEALPKICAIGPATSEEIRGFGHDVALQPSLYQAEGIIDEFTAIYGETLSGINILIPRARVARTILPEKLSELGAEVDVVPVYETRVPAGSGALLEKVLNEHHIDLITFTSSSTVQNLVSLAGDIERITGYDCAVIGPITAQTAKEYGLRTNVQPVHSTIPDFVRAIERYLTASEEL